MDHVLATKKNHGFINIPYVLWKGVDFCRMRLSYFI